MFFHERVEFHIYKIRLFFWKKKREETGEEREGDRAPLVVRSMRLKSCECVGFQRRLYFHGVVFFMVVFSPHTPFGSPRKVSNQITGFPPRFVFREMHNRVIICLCTPCPQIRKNDSKARTNRLYCFRPCLTFHWLPLVRLARLFSSLAT